MVETFVVVLKGKGVVVVVGFALYFLHFFSKVVKLSLGSISEKQNSSCEKKFKLRLWEVQINLTAEVETSLH